MRVLDELSYSNTSQYLEAFDVCGCRFLGIVLLGILACMKYLHILKVPCLLFQRYSNSRVCDVGFREGIFHSYFVEGRN